MTRTHRGAIALLTLAPLLANAGLITGLADCDPALIFGQMTLHYTPGYLPGAACYVDPAVAVITRPLGYLSAQDWLHGIIPWWNPYNGVGLPLAAEMQNESFFLPFVLLLHFPQGWFLQRLAFQILAGIFSYAFLAELDLSSAAALFGGILFSLNGTFFLTAGPVAAPILFLPLLMLGIEHARRAAVMARPMGWSLVPLGVAGSIYSGFPETAYLDGLLCAVWASLRLFQLPSATRWSAVCKLAIGATIGLALTAPLALPFLDYLRLGNVGVHVASLVSNTILPRAAAPLSLLPLAYGALAVPPPDKIGFTFQYMWGRIGGWYGCGPVFLALYALVPKPKLMPERLLLAAWAALWQARFFGAPGLIAAIDLLPGMKVTDCIRYAPLSVEFVIFVLAAAGLDDCLKHRPRPRSHLLWPALAFSGFLAASLLPAFSILRPWFTPHPELTAWNASLSTMRAVALCSGLLSTGTLVALITTIQLRRRLWLAPCLMALGSITLFLMPQLSAARSGHIDKLAIRFLQHQPGIWRFYTTAPLQPNLGAINQLASINYLQLPTPKLWTDYIQSELLPTSDPVAFTGLQNGRITTLLARLTQFESLGVKFIITVPDPNPPLDITYFQPGAQRTQFAALRAGQSIVGAMVSSPLQIRTIYGITISVGTFMGAANGPMAAVLCSGAQCADGEADLGHALDNQMFLLPLAPPLTLSPGQPLSYRFTHIRGTKVAIWLTPDHGASQHVTGPSGPLPGLTPLLGVLQSPPPSVPLPVFSSPAMEIYQLPNTAPYAQTSGGCSLQVISRQSMRTDCANSSTLLRRELFFPGWRAHINGVPVAIMRSGIFQQIRLPAGLAAISFTYMPPGTPRNCVIALLAALIWLVCAAWDRLSMQIKR